jgi:hypothetical protein
MDRWWWIQNLIFALSPAAMIAVSMELWGKPYVEKRSKEIELFNRLQMGLLDDDVDAEQESEVAASKSPSNTTDDPRQPQPSRDSHQTPSDETLQAHQTAVIIDDPTTVDLHRRIQMLEQTLAKQDRKVERLLRSQQQRLNQSGIQNRLDERLKLKDLQAKEDATATTTKEPVKLALFTIAQESIARNFREKRDAIIDSGRQLLDSMHSEDSNKRKVDPAERLVVPGPSPRIENAAVASHTRPGPAQIAEALSRTNDFQKPNPTERQEQGWLSWYRIFPQRSLDVSKNNNNPESKPSCT